MSRSLSTMGIFTHIASSIVIGNNSSKLGRNITSPRLYTSFMNSRSIIPRNFMFAGGAAVIFFISS